MLYHYTSPKTVMQIIREEGICLRFSRYDCLNDTSEGKEAVTVQQEICDALKKAYSSSQRKLDLLDEISAMRPDFKSIYVEDAEASVIDPAGSDDRAAAAAVKNVCMIPAVPYICSFSRESDALTMWNYYTKGTHYEGYNVGLSMEGLQLEVFDSDAEKDCSCESTPKPELKCEWWTVIYDRQRQCDKVRSEIERILQTGIFNREEYTAQLNNWAIRFKNDIFRHEKEERLICYVPEDEASGSAALDDYIHFRVVNGCLVPYLDVLIADKSVLQEINIGPLIEEQLAKNTMELFLRLKGYGKVKINTSNAPIRY